MIPIILKYRHLWITTLKEKKKIKNIFNHRRIATLKKFF